ncbi:hypothetical protein J2X19_000559 [Rhodoferax ferrireducens]|uniref:LysR substrate-binding domain-containing protein n=2 Tax=Rhodoferax ferrireducens TaxID=192843 RepID=A0ABU2C3K6_9BURK|nr:hypothetical protein [Rhodoferax ferrireducens]
MDRAIQAALVGQGMALQPTSRLRGAGSTCSTWAGSTCRAP